MFKKQSARLPHLSLAILAITAIAPVLTMASANQICTHCELAASANSCKKPSELHGSEAVLNHLLPPSTLKVSVANVSEDGIVLDESQQDWDKGSADPAQAMIRIDASKKFQSIDGWGGALTASCALNLQKMAPAKRRELFEKVFSPSRDGISYVRLPVGASDFSLENYSYADDPKTGLKTFSMKKDEPSLQILKEIQAVNPNISIMLSPWSAPAWMKDTKYFNGGQLDPKYRQIYAEYLRKTVQEYQSRGFKVKELTVQNEPHLPWPSNVLWKWPAMVMSAEDEKKFVMDFLGPELDRVGLKTKIIINDHNYEHAPLYEDVLKDKKYRERIGGIAFHCYGGELDEAAQLLRANPGVKGMNTECSGQIFPNEKKDHTDFEWWMKNQGIGAMEAGLTGTIGWNLCLDENSGPTNKSVTQVAAVQAKNDICKNCRGMITIDQSGNEPKAVFNPEYQVLTLFARVAPPGARRIATEMTNTNEIASVAFENPDGTYGMLILNQKDQPQTVQVSGDGCKSRSVSVPPNGVITVRWKP